MKNLVVAAIAALALSRAFAAEPVPADVAEFSRTYLAALQEKGMAGIVPMLHPEAQAAFKSQLMVMYGQEGRESVVRRTFGDDMTIAKLEAMPDEEFLTRAMQSHAEYLGADAGKSVQSIAIVGVVREGELIHVITRTVADVLGQTVTAVEVTQLKRHGKEWRALLATTFTGEPRATPRPRALEGVAPPPPPPPPPPRR